MEPENSHVQGKGNTSTQTRKFFGFHPFSGVYLEDELPVDVRSDRINPPFISAMKFGHLEGVPQPDS